jgi:hypothetical protein
MMTSTQSCVIKDIMLVSCYLISYMILGNNKINPEHIKYEVHFLGIIYNIPKLSNILRGNMQSRKGGFYPVINI